MSRAIEPPTIRSGMEPTGRERGPTKLDRSGARAAGADRDRAGRVLIVVVGQRLRRRLRDDDGRRRRSTEAAGCDRRRADAENAVEDGYYVLEEGEDLSDVAEQTCIPVERAAAAEPEPRPAACPVGGCVDLVVDGCKALAEG